MVVSASSLKSSDDAEVDVNLQFAQSPAKVICHSPGRAPAAFLRLLVLQCVVGCLMACKGLLTQCTCRHVYVRKRPHTRMYVRLCSCRAHEFVR